MYFRSLNSTKKKGHYVKECCYRRQSIKHINKFYLMANIDCINISLPFQVIESQLVSCNARDEGRGGRGKATISVSILNNKNITFESILCHCVFLKLVFFFLLLSHISLEMIKILTESHFKQ